MSQMNKPANVFANKDFVLLLAAQIVSGFGSSLTGMALLLLVNALTQSPASIATLVIVEAVPTIAFGLLAGAYVDRSNQKLVMILSDALRAVTMLGFCLIHSREQLPFLYGLVFLQAAVGTFFNPSRGAIMQRILAPEEQMRANSISQTTDPLVRVLGTAVAGFMIGTSKLYWPAFVLDAITFVVAATLAAMLRVSPRSSSTKHQQTESYWSSLTAGFAYIARSKIVVVILLAAAVTMLGLGALSVLKTSLLINDMKATATWFAPIELANVIGTVLAGTIFATVAARTTAKILLPVCLFSLAAVTVLLSLVRSPLALAGVEFLFGMNATPLNIGIATIIQKVVPNQMMGRFGASANLLVEMASLTSMAFAGLLGASLGIRNVFLLSAAIVAAAAVIAWLMLLKPNDVQENQAI